MVERVKINTNEIVLKDSGGNTIFTTSNLYIKNDPNGTLKAGGYQRVPVFTGYGTAASVLDKPALGGYLGWYKTGNDAEVSGREIVFNSPGFTEIKSYVQAPSVTGGLRIMAKYSSDTLNITLNNVNIGTFKWSGMVIGAPLEGGPQIVPIAFLAYPDQTTISIYGDGRAGGTVKLPGTTKYYNVVSNVAVTFDFADGSDNPEFKFSLAVSTLQSPATLSLAVTP